MPQSEIVYLQLTDIQDDKLNLLFRKVGWPIRFSWKNLLSLSLCVLTGWSGKNLIAFGRLFEKNGDCVLYDLVVDPTYQRKGIGESIVKKLETKAKELGYKELFADSDSKSAQKLFMKLKYNEISLQTHANEKIFYKKIL